MANPIKKNEVIEDGLFDPTIKSAKELIAVLDKVTAEMKELAKISKETIKNADFKEPAGAKKINKAITELSAVEKEYQKALKQRDQLQAKMFVQEGKLGRENEKNTIRARERKKAIKDQAREELGLTSAYEKQSRKLNELRKKYKDMALTQGTSTRAARKLRKEITQLDGRLKRVDASVGQFQRNVGNYTSAFRGLGNVLGAAGLTLGIAGFFRVMRNGIGIIRDFEQANADLSAVLGKNKDQITALTEDAKRLGESTIFTASQISGLQKEFAKLGFEQEDILNVTEATLQLAAATGTDLARAAEVTGNTIRAFGLETSETQRIVDVMAKSFTKSALDMERFATAMGTVAPVAKSAGLSVERTTALLGTLVSAGVDASTAGTGLRNVFLELSKQGISFEEAMGAIQEATDKNAVALELFGKRGATVGTILAENTVKTNELNDALLEANGTTKEMAEKQLDTLAGQLKLLKSAWEGFIIRLSEGTGALGGLKNLIGFVARNLESIIKVVVRGAAVWGAYRLALLLVNKETGKLKSFGIITFLKNMLKGVVGLTTGVKGAAGGIRTMSTAIKSIPFVGWIAGLTAVIPLIGDLIKGTTRAAIQQERFNRAQEVAIENTKELTEATDSAIDARIKLEKKSLALRLKVAKTEEAQTIARKRTAVSLRNFASSELRKLEEESSKLTSESRRILLEKELGGVNSKEGKKRRREITFELTALNEKIAELTAFRDNAEKKSLELFESIQQSKGAQVIETNEEIKKSETNTKKEELTRLQELKKELKEVQKAREKALTTPEAQESREFQIQTKRSEALKEEIGFLEAILDLELKNLDAKEDEITVDEKGIITLKKKGQELAGIESHRQAAEEAEQEALLAEQRQENIAKQIEGIKSVTDVIAEEAQRRLQIQQQAIDEELGLARQRSDGLRRLAERGQLEAGQSLAVEEKRIAELERKKIKAKQREQRIEATVAGFKLLSDKIDNNEERPAAETIRDILQLSAVLSGLPSFYEGTENVGASLGNPHLNTSRDQYVVRVDKNERIVDPANNQKIGSLSNDELASAAEMYSMGINSDSYKYHQMPNALIEHSYMTNAQILKKFDQLSETVERSNEQIARAIDEKPVHFFQYDQVQNAVIEGVKRSNKTEQTHRKMSW